MFLHGSPAAGTPIHLFIHINQTLFLGDGLLSARPDPAEAKTSDCRFTQTNAGVACFLLRAGRRSLNPGGGCCWTSRPWKYLRQWFFGWVCRPRAGSRGGSCFGGLGLCRGCGAGQAEAGQGIQSPIWVYHHIDHYHRNRQRVSVWKASCKSQCIFSIVKYSFWSGLALKATCTSIEEEKHFRFAENLSDTSVSYICVRPILQGDEFSAFERNPSFLFLFP